MSKWEEEVEEAETRTSVVFFGKQNVSLVKVPRDSKCCYQFC